MTFTDRTSENIVVKGENACNQHFLLFSNNFYHIKDKFHKVTFKLSSANTFLLNMYNNLSVGNKCQHNKPVDNISYLKLWQTIQRKKGFSLNVCNQFRDNSNNLNHTYLLSANNFRSVFTNHSQEYVLSFPQRCNKAKVT